MPYLIVKHKVKDFDQWLDVFNSHAAAQEEAGFRDVQILRDYQDPNIVFCFFKVVDIVKARTFTQAPDMGDVIEKAGVIGVPEGIWLEEL